MSFGIENMWQLFAVWEAIAAFQALVIMTFLPPAPQGRLCDVTSKHFNVVYVTERTVKLAVPN